jgi:hypothetical protein
MPAATMRAKVQQTPRQQDAGWQRIREERAELWAALLRHEIGKLERRGENIRPELLDWAWKL